MKDDFKINLHSLEETKKLAIEISKLIKED